ncbi:Solute carrier family 28 member 3 [Armadillidium nasatum]|uniref:Sodium/nucleoside cotransporter n=1 Tax=Armadillidium nasatum TaxID=96803 RepID=A0A5N5SM60_9CRUS|nr:Solute carrier family 28 member 3 [Armadillidium nasatum]
MYIFVVTSFRICKILIIGVIIVVLIVFYILDTSSERRRLTSFIGLAFIYMFGFVFSAAPRRVNWRPVIFGLAFQFCFALLVLRWPLGNRVIACLSDKVSQFLNYTTNGAVFVFGPLGSDTYHIFAFTVLPVTVFFSFCASILYYYGIVQWLVIKLGWLFKVTIGTTLCESMNAAGSIFLGQTESPLLVKPYLPLMTNSELHSVMTAGFATVAGSVLAAYISFGARADLLITASVMNAPAALALSKLFYPELSKTKIDEAVVKGIKSTEVNALHAGCVGVSNAIPLVANIAANLIAFIALIAFLDDVFDWACQLVSIEEGICTLESVFGYIFMPLAWMMGIQWSDCFEVGQLLGLKIIVNEFVAYEKLSEFMSDGTLSERSESIATFAICGFGNISSIGIMMGGLGPLAPERKNDLARLVVRAMIAGSMATFSSACIAGTSIRKLNNYNTNKN